MNDYRYNANEGRMNWVSEGDAGGYYAFTPPPTAAAPVDTEAQKKAKELSAREKAVNAFAGGMLNYPINQTPFLNIKPFTNYGYDFTMPPQAGLFSFINPFSGLPAAQQGGQYSAPAPLGPVGGLLGGMK